jgi:hypothetical protein
MADVSPRNCLGLQVPLDPAGSTRRMLDAVRDSVGELREAWHVHTERIVPVGDDAALRTFLARPEWFGGAVVLGGRFSPAPILPIRNAALSDKRILLATCNRASAADVESHRSMAHLLNAAGTAVTTRRFDVDSLDCATVLADVNAWIIEGVCVAA